MRSTIVHDLLRDINLPLLQPTETDVATISLIIGVEAVRKKQTPCLDYSN